MLGRWLGLTPEQPAHCLRGFPECPRAASPRVGLVTLPGPGRRGVAQGAARGLYAARGGYTICPTQCNIPLECSKRPLVASYTTLKPARYVVRTKVTTAQFRGVTV